MSEPEYSRACRRRTHVSKGKVLVCNAVQRRAICSCMRTLKGTSVLFESPCSPASPKDNRAEVLFFTRNTGQVLPTSRVAGSCITEADVLLRGGGAHAQVNYTRRPRSIPAPPSPPRLQNKDGEGEEASLQVELHNTPPPPGGGDGSLCWTVTGLSIHQQRRKRRRETSWSRQRRTSLSSFQIVDRHRTRRD